MNKRPKLVSDDDRALFREAIGEVRRVRSDQVAPEPSRPAPVPRQRQADEQSALQETLSSDPELLGVETGEELLYQRPGLQKGVMRKLRRGQFRIDADLDLHGTRADPARRLLSAFLAECRSMRLQCVRIVHGKGLRSEAGTPVLKPLINEWLRQRDEVLAFCSARPADGGTGAVYVLLRRG